MTTSTLSTSTVHELNNHELEQINGGFIWKIFLAKKLIKLAVKGIAKLATKKGQVSAAKAIKTDAKYGAAMDVGLVDL